MLSCDHVMDDVDPRSLKARCLGEVMKDSR
jgi:hypothetical protein